MKPQEKAKELSKKYNEIVEYSVEQCLIEMHEWDKQRFIEWVAEWLKGVRLDYYSENIKEFIEKFKKVAEEQL